MKIKKLLSSLMVACVVAGATPVTMPKTEAAIPVIDVKNIAETVKVYLETTKVLTETQKQVAMALLNMKKLKFGDAMNIWKIADKKSYDEFGLKLNSFFDPKNKTVDFLAKHFPDTIGQISRGQVKDPYAMSVLAYRGIEDMTNTGLLQAKFVNEANKATSEITKKALDHALKAEGTLQAQQAQSLMTVATNEAISEGNRQVATTNAIIATKIMADNQKEAYMEAQDRAAKESFSKFANKLPSGLSKRISNGEYVRMKSGNNPVTRKLELNNDYKLIYRN